MLLTSSLLAASTALAPGLVARVADQPITKAEYDHWIVIADKTDGSDGTKVAELGPQVMQLLISFRWIDLEAKRMGITVSDGAVEASFRKQKRQSFPKEQDFQEFLATSGQTVEDVKLRVRLDLMSNKIRDRVVAPAKTSEGESAAPGPLRQVASPPVRAG